MLFADLGLAEPILRAVIAEGYKEATPVQAGAIPPALAGKDVLACAQTGTGKTAAFALPMLQRLSQHSAGAEPAAAKRRARALILCPTRELASQIREAFVAYGKNLTVRTAVIFGGVNQNPQVNELRRGVDVIVATPGRLMDLMNQGHVDLRGIEMFVLDEADRMLDMGFIPDIRRIAQQLPNPRQTMLFSATMSSEIRRLTDAMLTAPVSIQIAAVKNTTDLIEQRVYHVERKLKPALLAHLVAEEPMFRTIVFTRTKHGADRLVLHLHKYKIRAEAIHGNKSQNARQRALANFKNSKTAVLVATDVAARGIDIDDVTHVVNYDVTHEPETYVHRIGRTGRAGAAGVAIALCDREEIGNLRAIEKLLRKPIPVKPTPTSLAALPSAPAGDSSADSGERSHRTFSGGKSSHDSSHGTRRSDDGRAQRSSQGHAAPARREPTHVTGRGAATTGRAPQHGGRPHQGGRPPQSGRSQQGGRPQQPSNQPAPARDQAPQSGGRAPQHSARPKPASAGGSQAQSHRGKPKGASPRHLSPSSR